MTKIECNECKDTRVYQGLGAPEPCESCCGKPRRQHPPVADLIPVREFFAEGGAGFHLLDCLDDDTIMTLIRHELAHARAADNVSEIKSSEHFASMMRANRAEALKEGERTTYRPSIATDNFVRTATQMFPPPATPAPDAVMAGAQFRVPVGLEINEDPAISPGGRPTAVTAFLARIARTCADGGPSRILKRTYTRQHIENARFQSEPHGMTVVIDDETWRVMTRDAAKRLARAEAWRRVGEFSTDILAHHFVGGSLQDREAEVDDMKTAGDLSAIRARIERGKGRNCFAEHVMLRTRRGKYLAPYDGQELPVPWGGEPETEFYAYRQK